MSARDDPSDPLYWPAAPLLAVTGPNPGPIGPARVWLVHDLPPQPWPALANGAAPVDLGPPGTVWQFGSIDLTIRYTFEGARDAAAFARGSDLYHAPVLSPAFSAYIYQAEQGFSAMSLDLWRVSIVAKVASVEQAINVLHYVDGPGPGHTDDPDGAAMVAASVEGRWWDAWNGIDIPAGGVALRTIYPGTCRFIEVRCARIRLTAQTKHAAVPPAKHATWDGPAPEYRVDTVYSDLMDVAGWTGRSAASLPLEVAMCVSLGTGVRGPRYRGRSYLGPLGTDTVTGGDGLFSLVAAQGVATTWKAKMLTAMAAEPVPLQLVVASTRYATAQPVTDVRVGLVPDSQRRRRRSQNEAYLSG